MQQGLSGQSLAKATVKSYRQVAARLRAIFAEFAVDQVTPKHAALALHGPVKRLTVFYGRRNAGGPPGYGTILKQWRHAVKVAGVPDANLHDLRAVAITSSHRQGGNAQGLAGHSSAAMTRRYIRGHDPALHPRQDGSGGRATHGVQAGV